MRIKLMVKTFDVNMMDLNLTDVLETFFGFDLDMEIQVTVACESRVFESILGLDCCWK